MPSRKRPAEPSSPTAIQTPCSKCHLLRSGDFRTFEQEELEFIQGFKVGELRVQAGSSIVLDGHDSPHLYTVLEGWAIRFKILGEGERQVLNFAMPGDLIGLQSTLFDKMQHSVEALTDVRLCVFARERIWELYREHPGLGFDLTWLAAREESILSDHLANVGQRSAFERLAYIIIYIFNRARRSGLVKGNKLVMPVTQEHLADAMGLSMVHTNKSLKKLRQTGWLEWKRQELAILDEEKLTALAAYDVEGQRVRPFL